MPRREQIPAPGETAEGPFALAHAAATKAECCVARPEAVLVADRLAVPGGAGQRPRGGPALQGVPCPRTAVLAARA
jgi:hypothetical protein